jgi:hypothetical protein
VLALLQIGKLAQTLNDCVVVHHDERLVLSCLPIVGIASRMEWGPRRGVFVLLNEGCAVSRNGSRGLLYQLAPVKAVTSPLLGDP